MRTFVRPLLASAAFMLATLPTAHAELPTGLAGGNLKIVVGYAAGGAADTVARLYAEQLKDAGFGSVLVDNKPGANSIIGVDAVAKAPADGTTFGVVIAAYAANTTLYPKLPYDPLKDLVPVALVSSSPIVMAAPAQAAYPNKPIRLVVPFPPGGGTDILARVIGQKLGDMWKTQVIVENRAGASGTIAADFVAKQPGDGSILHMAHINSHAIVPGLQKLGYDAEKDFQPISMVGVTPNLLICNQNQPAKTVKDLV
eukprot:gene69551-biopygen40294